MLSKGKKRKKKKKKKGLSDIHAVGIKQVPNNQEQTCQENCAIFGKIIS